MNKQPMLTTWVLPLTLLATTLVSGCQKSYEASPEKSGSEKSILTDTQDNAQAPHATAPWVTVWVHGTSMTPISKFHASPAGLRKVKSLSSGYLIKKTIKSLCAQDPELFNATHFYTFGWSGKLSPKEREKAAHELNQALEKLVQEYRACGQTPQIRLITHSHGGNVVLNLANVAEAGGVSVDELILLACPVQHTTEHLIASPRFKKIYAFYSEADVLQVLDPQGMHPRQKGAPGSKAFFSKRYFPAQDNLIQARVKIKGRAPTHVEFIMSHFVQQLPALLKSADSQKESKTPPLVRC
jgi:hypothetical protein